MKKKSEKLDVIKYFITKILAGILSFVTVSLYTYLIEPEIYGEYSLIIGIINIVISVFIGWISSSCLRYYTKYSEEKEKFYTNVFFQWIVSILISIVVLILCGVIINNVKILNYIMFVILLFIFNSTQDIFNSIIRAARKTNLYFFVIIGQYVINILGFIILFKFFDMKLESIFISSTISYIVLTVISVMYFKIYKYINIKYISKDLQYEFLKYGIPMIGVWGINWILNYSDRYIIKLFYTNYEVGLYDIATKLAENSINMLITSLSMAMMPILIDKYTKYGKEVAEKEHGRFLRYYFILTIPSIVGLIMIRQFIYSTLISKEYIEGINVIIWISLSMLFVGFNQFIYKLWQLKEKTNKILIFMGISVITNIILNLIFIPKYGFICAAITTLAANILSSVLALIAVKRDFDIIIDKSCILKVVLSSLVMAIFLYFALNNTSSIILTIIIIVLAVIIYFTLLILLGGLNEEIELLKKVKLKFKNK